MCIDDKGISHEGHTIMSNYNTGKIALLIESTKKEELEAALDLFGANKLKKYEVLTVIWMWFIYLFVKKRCLMQSKL